MYRFFEILPAALAWLTIILMVVLSRVFPAGVAVFIILFDLYWLLKTIYLSFHLRSTFSEMKKNLKVNWLEKLKQMANGDWKPATSLPTGDLSKGDSQKPETAPDWRNIYHLIIFPMYTEPYEVVRESFESLAKANYPEEKFIVVLAIEEHAGAEAKAVADRIRREFAGNFFKFLITVHPSGLSGEIPGKGSNETWAARRAKEEIIDPLIAAQNAGHETRSENNSGFALGAPPLSYTNILVSIFDIDTQVPPEYFGRLTYVFLRAEHPLRAVYQPIPLFTNNIYRAPALARVVAFSSTFWQMMQQARPERLTTFSSQSLPFQVLVDIGFWHTDVVSEDSRIFWQGYLHYHGDFRVEPLLYPVSLDANAAPTFLGTMKNLYRQQRRWGWGVENTPYLLDGFQKDPNIPRRKKWYWSFSILEGFHSWATNSIIIFALGWLPVLLGGAQFNATVLSYSLPAVTRIIVELSMVGIASSAILSFLLLPPRPAWFRKSHSILYFFQWLLLPITLIFLGAIPGLEAQTRLALGGKYRLGFWPTPKNRI